jgi:hypothetical protein
MSKREIEMKHRGSADVLKEFSEALIHNIPKLMFFLLPVFALILKLVYVRRKIYLFDHAIFTLHFHSFIFLFFTLLLLVSLFVTVPNLYLFAFLATLTYLLIAMRKVYRQSWGKTTVKLLTILFLYSFIGIFVMVGYVFVSLLMI